MAGLDDPGVDRPDRDLDHPLAVHAGHGHVIVRDARDRLAPIEVLAQRVHAVRPVRMQHEPARVGVALRIDAEEVLRLALVPVGRWHHGRDRRERGMRWVQHRAHRDELA